MQDNDYIRQKSLNKKSAAKLESASEILNTDDYFRHGLEFE